MARRPRPAHIIAGVNYLLEGIHMSDDPTHNPPDEKSWPDVQVLIGWVHDVDAFQIGFSLSPAWQPPQDLARRTDSKDYLFLLPRMNFPDKLTSWLLHEFMLRKVSAISVVRYQNRWRVHIGLTLIPSEAGALLELVESLAIAAGLHAGGDGQHIAEMEAIQRDNPDYQDKDVRYHWLGDRIQQAVQKMFDDARK